VNTLIVADFDETLIEQNTLLTVYRDLTRTPLAVSVILAFLKGRWLWRGPRAAIKEEMYRRMLRGKHETELARTGRRIAPHVTLNRPVVSHIRQFLQQDHDLIVASAALAPIVQAILEEKGLAFSRVVATQAEVMDGKLTGRLPDGECFGKVKARRVRRLRETSYPGARIVAFGNWPDDGPLLAEADEGYIVTGNTIKRFGNQDI